MSTHKNIDRICCVVIALCIVLTVFFMFGESFGLAFERRVLGYEDKLFDSSYVHTLNIEMDDWDEFISTAAQEEYVESNLTIDGEKFATIAIRAKGNTSLTQVQSYDNGRYSFKVEFDHYDSDVSYHGLDKLSLNNIIQDNTYVKDYLTYTLMAKFGVNAPLCSFVFITVNGEDWGLYLAVEGVEESFLERNYGDNYGELYKPDSMSMGGGRGNGQDFDIDEFDFTQFDFGETDTDTNTETDNNSGNQTPGGSFDFGNGGFNFEGMGGFTPGEQGGFTPGGDIEIPDISGGDIEIPDISDIGGVSASFGSSDVSLIYSDDDYDSYSNIFDNAKTAITDKDKDRLISSLKKLNEQTDIEDVVDVEQVIRYFVVHNFVVNFDSYTGSMIHNYYLYEDDGQLSMIPWDYNLAFGGFQSSSDATSIVNYPIDTPVSGGDVSSRPMLSWIFSDETYTNMYHEYFSDFISEYFDSGYFSEMMAELKAMLSPYVEKDPTKFCTYDEFSNGFDTLTEFCILRAESISGQLDGTIPSTSDGQSDDSTSLIDASNIKISDMGSMNNGGMGDAGDMGGKAHDEKPNGGSDITPPTDNPNGGSDITPPTDNPNGDGTATPPTSNFGGNGESTPPTDIPNGNGQGGASDGKIAENPDGNTNPFKDMNGDKGGEMPNGEIPSQNEGTSTESVLLTAISIAVLAAGLTFAILYKKKA